MPSRSHDRARLRHWRKTGQTPRHHVEAPSDSPDTPPIHGVLLAGDASVLPPGVVPTANGRTTEDYQADKAPSEPVVGQRVDAPTKWGNGMGQGLAAKEAEYQGHAAVLRQLAEQSQSDQERETLLRHADAWTELADRLRRLSQSDD